MKTIFLVFLAIVLVLAIVGIIATQFARRLVPTCYEWLLVLSHHEWKRAPRLIEEILKLKKSQNSFGLRGIVYSDLSMLLEENLIQDRLVPSDEIDGLPLTEYRLTSRGTHRKNESTVHEGEKLPLSLQPN